MTARWTPLAALATGLSGAILITLLVLGRDTEVFPTYLVHTADPQPLPHSAFHELPDGTRLPLRFEQIPVGDAAADVVRRNRGLAQPHIVGLVLDRQTYDILPRTSLYEWRQAGVVMLVYNVDSLQIAFDLATPGGLRRGANMYVLSGPADQSRIVGDPSSLNREQPFVGLTYLPPR